MNESQARGRRPSHYLAARDPAGGGPPAAARALLKLRFSPQDQQRMGDLSSKARAGTLTSEEQADIDTYERLGCLLDILHSQARRALNKKGRTAS